MTRSSSPMLEHPLARRQFPVGKYDLDATLTSGQAFRWERVDGGWESVIAGHWVRLIPGHDSILAETVESTDGDTWLADYLQVRLDLAPIVATFPQDEPMRAAVRSCHGLRLLRQDPWECLASFILSSTKQIVQIQQIVRAVCERFGECVPVPAGHSPAYSFPKADRIAACSEGELRGCKMGFRAPYLRGAARMIANSEIDLSSLRGMALAEARETLLQLPGVGRKVADCVLLFAYGFQDAFPIDVWVTRALRELYFRGRHVPLRRLERFSGKHFGPFGGYAQQYLFHYRRQLERRIERKPRKSKGAVAASRPRPEGAHES